MHNNLAVNGFKVNDVGLIGGVGKGYTLEAEQLGGNRGDELLCGVSGVFCFELILCIIINSELRSISLIKGEAFVNNVKHLKAPVAAGCGALCIDYREVNGADLAVVLLEPIKVITVALGVNVGAGNAIEVVDVIVGKACANRFLDQRGYLVNSGGDVVGEGGVNDILNGGFLYPRKLGIVGNLNIISAGLEEPSVGELIAALVAKLVCAGGFGIKDPPGLGCKNGSDLTNFNRCCKVSVEYVNGVGIVNEVNAVGNHAAGIGDLCNGAGNLNKLAFLCVAGSLNGHFGVSTLIKNDLVEFDHSCVLNLGAVLKGVQSAGKKNLVTLLGLIGHACITDGAVLTVGAVNRNRTGLVLNDHSAVCRVGNGSNGCVDVVSFGGGLAGELCNFGSLCNGNYVITLRKTRAGLGFDINRRRKHAVLVSEQFGLVKFNGALVVLNGTANCNVVAKADLVGILFDLVAVNGVFLVALYNKGNVNVTVLAVVAVGLDDLTHQGVGAIQNFTGFQSKSHGNYGCGITELNAVKYRGLCGGIVFLGFGLCCLGGLCIFRRHQGEEKR